MVIDIHGGPAEQAQPVYLGGQNSLLNEMGIALIFPNIRGSSGYGKTFRNLDNHLRREDSYRDIEALLDWIAAQPGLDPARVMARGSSYGGNVALAVAARCGDRIRCVIAEFGIANLVTGIQKVEPMRQPFDRAEYGDERDPRVRLYLQ